MKGQMVKKEVEINAPANQVWQVLIDPFYSSQWLSSFGSGSQVEANWMLGGTVVYKGDDGPMGLIGKVAAFEPAILLKIEFTNILHSSDVVGIGDASELDWIGCSDTYQLRQDGAKTVLVIQSTVPTAEYVTMFGPLWDDALKKVKELSEKIRFNEQIFVNIPVKDLDKSMKFFRTLGYAFNLEFTDEKAACLILSKNIYAMLLVEDFFQTFTKKPVADATKSTEVLLALSANSREEVDELVQQALAAGGSTANEPTDYGWMYSWSFQDLDGHIWEVFYADESLRTSPNL